MSKMPSKKKSCFQITSVTQAQVAANSIADDTESLDDPDESRTEDMSSSEMYDVSKAGDFEPEACDVSLSDEPEPAGASAQETPGSVHVNPNACAAPVSSQTSVSSPATVSTCSSRFRVIKLDHGTGEPFKRGRWTCTEFYERDTDARTVDAVKHAGTADHSADRDGPVAAHISTLADPHTDSGYVSAPSNPPVELQKQTFGILHQGLGLVAQNLFGDAHAQHVKSPSMPSTAQPQTFYPAQKAVAPSNQADYRLQALTQGPSPGLVPQPVDGRGLPIGLPEHVLGLLHQSSLSAAVVSQAPVPLIQPAVTVSVPGVQNVPVVMPSASNTPLSMPKQTPVPVVPPQQGQPQGIPSGSGVGLFSQANMLLHSSVLIGKDAIRPLNPEGLQLHTPAVNSLFGIAIPIDGDEDSASGASVVAIDNKIEQAMDLVKSHLMYAVREEVEVLKEQIKELYERNSVLERENAVLKSLANTDQLTQLGSQAPGSSSPPQEGSELVALPPQPNVSTV